MVGDNPNNPDIRKRFVLGNAIGTMRNVFYPQCTIRTTSSTGSSNNNVRNHLRHICSKLQVSSRFKAIAEPMRHNS